MAHRTSHQIARASTSAGVLARPSVALQPHFILTESRWRISCVHWVVPLLLCVYAVFKWSQVQGEMRTALTALEKGDCMSITSNRELMEACVQYKTWERMSTLELMIDATRRDIPVLRASMEWLLDVLFFKDLIRAVVVIFALVSGIVSYAFYQLFMVTTQNTQQNMQASLLTTRQLVGALHQRSSGKRQ